MKGNPTVPADASEDKQLTLLLRDAIDESGWKHAAVAEAMGLKGEAGASYLSKILAGEKPLAGRHIDALPGDVAKILSRHYAETFGHIVVQPLEGLDAVRALAGVMVGVARAAALPARAGAMARATPMTTAETKSA